MYNKAFLILKNKAKNSGIALQKDTLPEDEYLFFHSIKNQKKNYITSTNQFGGERFNLEDQMSVMLPSSNLESEAWRKLLREKTQLLRDSNNVAVYTQLEAMNQYKKTRQYCEERIDKFVSVIETSSHDAQIKFIEDELKTDWPFGSSTLPIESKAWFYNRMLMLEQKLYSVTWEHLQHMRARSLSENHHYTLLKQYLESQKEILLLLNQSKMTPLPASISKARPLEFKNHHDIVSSEVIRIATAIEAEQDKKNGPASADLLATRESQALVVEKSIRKNQADDALRAAGLEVPEEFTMAVKPTKERPILRATSQKNADGTSTFNVSSSTSGSSARVEAPTLPTPQETGEGFFSSIAAKVSDFTPSSMLPNSLISFAWDVKSLASGRGPLFPTTAVRPTASGEETLSKTEKEEILRKGREANAILDAREARVKAEQSVGTRQPPQDWGFSSDDGETILKEVTFAVKSESKVDSGAGTGLSSVSSVVDSWGLASGDGNTVVEVPFGGVKEKPVDSGAGTGLSRSLLEISGQDLYNFFIVFISSETINFEFICSSICSIFVWISIKQLTFYILPITKKYHMFRVYSVLSFFCDKF